MRIGVVGSNGFDVARSLKRLGVEVWLVDYYDDLDVGIGVDRHFPLQSDPLRPSFSQEYSHEWLVELALRELEDVEGVIAVSGLGCCWDALRKLEREFGLIGNSAEKVREARDWERLEELEDELLRLGVRLPRSWVTRVSRVEGLLEEFRALVVKSPTSAFGTRLVRDKSQVADLQPSQEAIVQEKLNGFPISVSVLATGNEAKAISVNDQLIGVHFLNPPTPLCYCGNVVPSERKVSSVAKASVLLAEELTLVGSNGFDFMLTRSGPYLLEVNPRPQDTLASVEARFNFNLMGAHLAAVQERRLLVPGVGRGFHGKAILYAKRDIRVGELSQLGFEVRNVPRPGALVRRAEPVCSVYISSTSHRAVLEGLRRAVRHVSALIIKTKKK